MSKGNRESLFEIRTHIELEEKEDVVSKTYSAILYNLEQPNPLDPSENTPAIMVFLGPAPGQEPIGVAKISRLKDFFLNNYPAILKHALEEPEEGDSFYDESFRQYDYTENRDILEHFVEKLPSRERRLLLSQTKLVGYLPGRRLQ